MRRLVGAQRRVREGRERVEVLLRAGRRYEGGQGAVGQVDGQVRVSRGEVRHLLYECYVILWRGEPLRMSKEERRRGEGLRCAGIVLVVFVRGLGRVK